MSSGQGCGPPLSTARCPRRSTAARGSAPRPSIHRSRWGLRRAICFVKRIGGVLSTAAIRTAIAEEGAPLQLDGDALPLAARPGHLGQRGGGGISHDRRPAVGTAVAAPLLAGLRGRGGCDALCHLRAGGRASDVFRCTQPALRKPLQRCFVPGRRKSTVSTSSRHILRAGPRGKC